MSLRRLTAGVGSRSWDGSEVWAIKAFFGGDGTRAVDEVRPAMLARAAPLSMLISS
jgi:hypothetical protein